MPRLELSRSLLVIIDVQGKLAHLVHEKEILHANLRRLVRCAGVLGMPVLWAEQNPAGLGPTIPEVAELLSTLKPFPKMTFSCVKNDEFEKALVRSGKKQILVAGIEAHVCVYQTVSDLLQQGYEPHVISDAVSSRLESNRKTGLDRMVTEGAVISSTEMAIFELLGTADRKDFREIVKLLK